MATGSSQEDLMIQVLGWMVSSESKTEMTQDDW